MSEIGRNEACPCGSGKKFKKCCLGKLAQPSEVLAWQNVQARQWIQLDHKLFAELLPRLQQCSVEVLDTLKRLDVPDDDGFVLNWIAHFLPLQGQTAARAFYQRGKMSGEMRRLLECQLESHLTLFQLEEIQPGRGVLLKDLLFEEEIFLWDVGISQSATPLAGMLGWVLRLGQVSLTGGMHTHLLPPLLLQGVLEKLKGHQLTREDLRGHKSELLIRLWQQALKEWVSSPPPQVANTDGEPLNWVEDRFVFPAGQRAQVWQALLSLPGAKAQNEDTIGFTEERPDEMMDLISVGTARVEGEQILLTSNSSKRADRLRKAVEKACAGLELEKKRRKTRQLTAAMSALPASDMSQEQLMQLPEVQAKMAEMRQRMNEKWLDLKNPLLGGRSPREMSASQAGRAKLETLLKEFEYRGDPPQEIAWLRAELKLD
ncbi:MAG: SEC-C metal-binding domain-containing protein [Vulcanimicrobiota bacterium]